MKVGEERRNGEGTAWVTGTACKEFEVGSKMLRWKNRRDVSDQCPQAQENPSQADDIIAYMPHVDFDLYSKSNGKPLNEH